MRQMQTRRTLPSVGLGAIARYCRHVTEPGVNVHGVCEGPNGQLAYAVRGTEDGLPVVFLAGLGQGRDGCLPPPPGIRLITLDRPGLGRSAHQPHRTVTDFTGDLSAVLDVLSVDTFAILGWSAGAPYALAAMADIPQRVLATTIAAPIAPPEARGALRGMDPGARAMWALAARSPAYVQLPLGGLLAAARVRPRAVATGLHLTAPNVDRVTLRNPAVLEAFAAGYSGCSSGPSAGLARELHLLSAPWNVDLSRVPGERLRIVVSNRDRLAPPSSGQLYERVFPGRVERVDAGHLWLWGRWTDAMQHLADRATAARVA